MATDDTIAAPLKVRKTAEALRPAQALPLTSRLSARLPWLTVAFVMLAEIGVFAPSLSPFRLDSPHPTFTPAHRLPTAPQPSPPPPLFFPSTPAPASNHHFPAVNAFHEAAALRVASVKVLMEWVFE